MFERIKQKYGNKGASLVLVIICMLFVGIIAAAVLTLTTGNIKNIQTGENSSDNFYSAETVVDDVKIYLQKIANGAATEAYAKTLDAYASGKCDETGMEPVYKKYFKNIMADKMAYELDTTNSDSLVSKLQTQKAALGISDTLTVNFDFDATKEFFKYDADSNTLKGVNFSCVDSLGYEVQIDTDLTFDCIMPPFGWSAGSSEYGFDVDKYIIISSGSITPQNLTFNGSITGSMYSGVETNLFMDSSESHTGSINLFSQYLISKGNINVKNGNLTIKGLKEANSNEKAFLKLKSDGTVRSQVDANAWVKGISLDGGKAAVTVAGANPAFFVADDLSLNGNYSKFTMNNGSYTGFGYGSKTYSFYDATSLAEAAHAGGSAIVINGQNSELDMSGMSDLTLLGTAYTQVPSIAGSTPEEQCAYLSQGESVTFKSLQSAYLVPGEYIKFAGGGTGYNPISEADWAKFEGVNAQPLIDAGINLSDYTGKDGKNYGKCIPVAVRYATSDPSADGYYFIYWSFATVGDAVKYYNEQFTNNKALLDSKIGMIGASGKIVLPDADKLHTRGYAITSTSSNKLGVANTSLLTSMDDGSIKAYKDRYKNAQSSLDPDMSIAGGNDIWTNLFTSSGLENVPSESSDATKIYKLRDPLNWELTLSDGTTREYSGSIIGDATDYNYILVTGYDIDMNTVKTKCENDYGASNKYIVIARNDVKNLTGTFNGIIFAKGDVLLSGTVSMKCFGNVKSEYRLADGSVKTEYLSEFDAVLRVIGDDSDPDDANTELRKIFGLLGSSALDEGAEAPVSDLTKVETSNYKKN